MTDKVILNNLTDLQNETTAVGTINANSAAITTAINNTLSRDGTSPNQMGANLDMNSKQILNLPAPATANSPLRFQDLNSFVGGGTVSTLPAGGNMGQVLEKNSATDYDTKWADIAGSAATSANSLVGNPTGAPALATSVPIGNTLQFSGGTLQTKALTGDVTTAANSFVTSLGVAAIAYNKIQNETAHTILGNPTALLTSPSEITLAASLPFSGNTITTAAMTGDVTSSAGSMATTIASNAVTNAKLAQMASNTLKGNNTGITANSLDLTPDQVTAILNTFTSSLKGLVSASGGGSSNFLRADGSWVPPPGSGGMTLLNTLTAATSASLQDTTSLTNTYSTYLIILSDIIPATNGANFTMQVHSGGIYQATNYLNSGDSVIGNGGNAQLQGPLTTAVQLTRANATSTTNGVTNATPGLNGFIYISYPSNATKHNITSNLTYVTNGGTQLNTLRVASLWNTSGVIDGFQFLFGSGNITSGVINIYGLT